MLIDDAKRLLRQAFETRRLAHAYLLVGAPRGVAGELAVDLLQRLAVQTAERERASLRRRLQVIDEVDGPRLRHGE